METGLIKLPTLYVQYSGIDYFTNDKADEKIYFFMWYNSNINENVKYL